MPSVIIDNSDDTVTVIVMLCQDAIENPRRSMYDVKNMYIFNGSFRTWMFSTNRSERGRINNV
ncbi:MAG: hypothetical protein QXV11_05745 [Desulfurococcaceae archaeon]